MQYKLLAVDLDGTYLARDGHPHEVDRRALVALREAGVIVTILTGRLYAGSRLAANSFGLSGPLGCADGSHLVDHRTGATLSHRELGALRSQFARRALQSVKGSVFAFGDDAIVLDARGEPFLPYMRTWSEDLRQVPRVLDHAWFEQGDMTAVVALGERDELQSARDAMDAACDAADLPRLSVALFPLSNAGSQHGLLARADGVSKGTALQWLCAHHGLAAAETVVVGDWINDVPMFEVAGLALAMGSAPDGVRQAAHRVLEETAERGGAMARIARDVFGVECT